MPSYVAAYYGAMMAGAVVVNFSPLYTVDELAAAFPGLELLHLDEYDAVLDEGPRHQGMSALVDLVARRPA